ncbi:MAG: metallophosphoesterase family protein [Bacteroidales bacterium]|jgi:putative phosphoesterase|nr:metallophosphoesterase family protein [Bacteroidales bacterium]
MMRIGLLSDTHGWIYPGIYDFFADCNEIWHAGDIGNAATYDTLSRFRPVRAVFGNIDGHDVRLLCPEVQLFHCDKLKVMMKHIGGYPGRYERSVKELLQKEGPDLFISGHSHILKVMYDNKHGLMHMNPGAAGRSGLHSKITCLRFSVQGKDIGDLEILEKDRKAL